MSSSTASDLQVSSISDALLDRRIDVVVSGSIAAVESVRFIRSLRRLGAVVTPWLTQGGSQFVTPLALEWAAAHPCVTSFSGTASHICTSDAVIIAPASAHIMTQIASGLTDTPASALVASALGQNKPVLILPAMHDSLLNAPAMAQHVKTLESWKDVHLMQSRLEEGKRKFPNPIDLADSVAHQLNRSKRPSKPVLLTMGTTRGYVDDVRYLSNYSSGKLGTEISTELYRQGFLTCVVSGPCEFKPHVSSTMIHVRTTGEMLSAAQEAAKSGVCAAVFAASVLDFEPETKVSGKISSSQAGLTLSLRPTPKIIGAINSGGAPKIGFKLETNLTRDRATEIARDYTARYQLTNLIVNDLSDVSATAHKACGIDAKGTVTDLASKIEIAKYVAGILKTSAIK